MTYTIMFRTVVKSGKIPIRKQVTKFCLKHANIVLSKLDIDKEFDWLLINQLRKRCMTSFVISMDECLLLPLYIYIYIYIYIERERERERERDSCASIYVD